jgi:hypothetical protein
MALSPVTIKGRAATASTYSIRARSRPEGGFIGQAPLRPALGEGPRGTGQVSASGSTAGRAADIQRGLVGGLRVKLIRTEPSTTMAPAMPAHRPSLRV